MRVLLLDPPYFTLRGHSHNVYPNGLGYLGTFLAERGHEVAICNADFDPDATVAPGHPSFHEAFRTEVDLRTNLENMNHPSWLRLRQVISDFAPDVIGITSTTPKIATARRSAALSKEICPQALVVLGGHHASALPEDVLSSPFIDLVVVGEGEQTLFELVHSGARDPQGFARIPGLFWRDHDTVATSGSKRPPTDLNSLPFPRRELDLNFNLLPPTKHRMITSRGCPFNCTFCAAHLVHGRRVRWVPIPTVIAEMRHLALDCGASQVVFDDDCFTLNRRRVLDLCAAIRQEDLGLCWQCNTRADTVDRELVLAMKTAGCNGIMLGVESGSDRILQLMRKAVTVAQCWNGTRLVDSSAVSLGLYFMIGLPGETVDEIRKTIRLMRQMKRRFLATIYLSVFTPYPGTLLCRHCVEAGIIDPQTDWSRYSRHSKQGNFTGTIPDTDFGELVQEAIEAADTPVNVFNRALHRMITRRFGKPRLHRR